MNRFDFIKHKYWFLVFSGALIVLGWLLVFVLFGWKWGIDFTGGTSWQIKFIEKQISRADLENALSSFGLQEVSVTPQLEGNAYIIRAKEISEADHQKYLGEIKNRFGNLDEEQFASIGPSIGEEVKQKAVWAVILVLIAISLYVAFAFRKVSYPVKSWKYGVLTLTTLFHDVSIPIGLFSVLSRFFNVETDTNFVVALLVVMGFSVHDTIVVFDRIRENLRLSANPEKDFDMIVNNSIHQTLARSINTSLTVILVLLSLLFLGPKTLFYFVLTILVGIAFGTYSSICIASPLLTLWRKK